MHRPIDCHCDPNWECSCGIVANAGQNGLIKSFERLQFEKEINARQTEIMDKCMQRAKQVRIRSVQQRSQPNPIKYQCNQCRSSHNHEECAYTSTMTFIVNIPKFSIGNEMKEPYTYMELCWPVLKGGVKFDVRVSVGTNNYYSSGDVCVPAIQASMRSQLDAFLPLSCESVASKAGLPRMPGQLCKYIAAFLGNNAYINNAITVFLNEDMVLPGKFARTLYHMNTDTNERKKIVLTERECKVLASSQSQWKNYMHETANKHKNGITEVKEVLFLDPATHEFTDEKRTLIGEIQYPSRPPTIKPKDVGFVSKVVRFGQSATRSRSRSPKMSLKKAPVLKLYMQVGQQRYPIEYEPYVKTSKNHLTNIQLTAIASPSTILVPWQEAKHSKIANKNVVQVQTNGFHVSSKFSYYGDNTRDPNHKCSCASNYHRPVCWDGEARVMLANGQEVPTRTLRVGDRVLCPRPPRVNENDENGGGGADGVATIAQVFAMPNERNEVWRLTRFHDFYISAHHPVVHEGKWQLPCEFGRKEHCIIDGLYNFELQQDAEFHTMQVNGATVSTLGCYCGERIAKEYPEDEALYGAGYWDRKAQGLEHEMKI